MEAGENRTDAEVECRAGLLPDQIVHVVRGFADIFWGVPLALVLLTHSTTLMLWARARLPLYLIGILIVFWGVILLRRAGPVSSDWDSLTQRMLWAVSLQLYLSPFLYWWRQAPFVTYLLGNVLLLAVCSAYLLILVTRLAESFATAIGDPVFRIEARLCRFGIYLLLALPLTSGVLAASVATIVYQSDLASEVLRLHDLTRPWTYAPLIVPFALTMAVAWKAKELGFRLLKLK